MSSLIKQTAALLLPSTFIMPVESVSQNVELPILLILQPSSVLGFIAFDTHIQISDKTVGAHSPILAELHWSMCLS